MFGALPDHIIEDKRLSHADIRVLLAMSLHANKRTGKAWPKANKLAERLGMSRSTVMSSLGKCVRLGLLTKRSRFENGLRMAMEYTFQFERFDSQRTTMSCENTTMSSERTTMTDDETTLYPSADNDVRAEVQQEQTSEQTNQQTQEQLDLTPPAQAPKTAAKKRRPKATLVRDNPPTLDEIQTYAADYGDKNKIDIGSRFSMRFTNYYTDEWVMKNGKPLSSWKRAVGSWLLRDADSNPLRDGVKNPRPGSPRITRPSAVVLRRIDGGE